jgi:hypothetical protein
MNFYELNKIMNDIEYQREMVEMYIPSIDGPPLKPSTIAGVEVQIRELATQIRTTFGLDEKWDDHKNQIFDATKILDQAADQIGRKMDGDKRNDPHKFHSTRNELRNA